MADFSIVIPVFERRRELERLLQSIARLDGDGLLVEVVVVDTRTPSNRQWLNNIHAWPFPLRYAFAGPGAQARGRNVGAVIATGRWLLFIDSDVELDRGLLIDLAIALQHNTILMPHVMARRGEPRTLATHLYDVPAFFPGYRRKSKDGLTFREFVSCCCVIERESFIELHGFDEGFVHYGYEDVEFALRAEANGLAFDLAPAKVFHHKRLTPSRVLQRFIQLGRSAVHFRQLHPGIESRLPLGVEDTVSGRLAFPRDYRPEPLIRRAVQIELRLAALRQAPRLSDAARMMAAGKSVYRELALFGRHRGICEALNELQGVQF